MYAIFKPMPLTRISLVAVSKCLWSSRTLPKITESDRYSLETKIIDSLSQLGLPVNLRRELEWLISIMGDSLKMWRDHTRKAERQMFGSGDLSPYKEVQNDQIRWTKQGEVARDAMALLTVRADCLNLFQAYRLSCYYCLVEFARFLLDQCTMDVKRILLKDSNYAVSFWTGFFLLGERPSSVAIYEQNFKVNLKDSNLFGAEYFWKQLPKQNREEFLKDKAEFNFGPLWAFAYHANFLNQDEWTSFYNRFGGVFMRRLVHVKQYQYIYREAFVETTHWIGNNELGKTTWNVAKAFFDNWPGCLRKDYDELFLSIWHSIPVKRKIGLMSNNFNVCAILLYLSRPQDVRFFRVVLSDLNEHGDRGALLQSSNGLVLLERFLLYKRLQAFKILVGNCVTPVKIRHLLISRRKKNIQGDPQHYSKAAVYTNDLNTMLRWFREMP